MLNTTTKLKRFGGRLAPLPKAPPEDAYSDAVAYLTAHPDEIHEAWQEPHTHACGILFRLAVLGDDFRRPDGKQCGCLTQIRDAGRTNGHALVAWTDELTAAIRADSRIPCSGTGIAPDGLDVFAEWNREIDRKLGRTPPARLELNS